MRSAAPLSAQREDSRADQNRNKQKRGRTVSPADAEEGMNQQAKENNRRLIHAKVCLSGIGLHRFTVEGVAHFPLGSRK